MPMQASPKSHLLGVLVWLNCTCLGQHVYAQTLAPSLLVTTVAQAVATHPSVQAARENRLGSVASYEAARWQYYPSPNVTTERSIYQTQRNQSDSTLTALSLRQNLWTGGRIDATVNAAQRRTEVAQTAIAEAQTNVAMRTLDAWVNLLTSFSRQQAASANLERLQSLAEMMGRRVERDISPGVDVVLMRSRLTQAQSELLSYRVSRENATLRLIQWVGVTNGVQNLTNADLALTLTESAERLPETTASNIQLYLEKQPPLRRNEGEIAVAQEELQQKKAEIWPSVYLRVERQFNDPGAASFFGKTAETKLFLGLQYTPGAGLAVRSNIQVADSRVAALQQERDSIRRELQDRVNSDWRDHLANGERLEYAIAAVRSANEVLESYTRLFVVGRRGWLDVLNAARELSLAEQSLGDLQAQQVVGIYRLRMYQGLFAWQNGG